MTVTNPSKGQQAPAGFDLQTATPADWGHTFTANRAHRFDTSTHRALCHKGITSHETERPGDRYAPREDYLSPLWSICPRCDAIQP